MAWSCQLVALTGQLVAWSGQLVALIDQLVACGPGRGGNSGPSVVPPDRRAAPLGR